MKLFRRAVGRSAAVLATALATALALPPLGAAVAAPAAPASAVAPATAAAVGPVKLYIAGFGSGPENIAVQSARATGLDAAVARGFARSDCQVSAGPTVVNSLPNGWVQVHIEYLCTGEPNAGSPTFVLKRYHKSSDTLSTPWDAPVGYGLQGPLGTLFTAPDPGTQPLYLCQVRGDHFATTDVGCEGQTYVTRLGWLYASPPAGTSTLPLLRCLRKENRQIFESHQPDCEGQIMGGTLGYLLP
ncbi:hypothetical protein [Streptomyces venezuelae]|uniref:hypothetical protein n=1 Tax=Streptomyces venezuelae TaxID=54571 RepID=UPI001CCFC176|nr:hypothetical protein [Streptomyces venezuelae]